MMRIPVWGFRVVRAMGSGGECYFPHKGGGPLCDRGNRPEFALCDWRLGLLQRRRRRCNAFTEGSLQRGDGPREVCSVEAKVKQGACSVEAKVKQVDGDGGRRCS
ncbi:hypothetical protein Adt_30369 [Abeliophyllum distichum]|uniref:Uncharacterized protein n=1 Tax=Abeliophyllum distichum TaxID=126358 RepID=A0ABD1RB28_9LAMI